MDQKIPAFVEYTDGTGELTMIDKPVRLHEGDEELRLLRVEKRVSLIRAGKLIGVSAVQLSGHESGYGPRLSAADLELADGTPLRTWLRGEE